MRSWSSAHRKHRPGERRFMENEQLKVSTKTLGLNFIETCSACSVCTAAPHRLMMPEGSGANRGVAGLFCRGQSVPETAVSLLVWDPSLENDGAALLHRLVRGAEARRQRAERRLRLYYLSDRQSSFKAPL